MPIPEHLYRKYKNIDRCEELKVYHQTLTHILITANLTDEEQYIIRRLLSDINEEAYEQHCE